MMPRLKTAVSESIQQMEEVHKDMSADYSNGVVAGYTKKLLNAKLLGSQRFHSQVPRVSKMMCWER